MAPERGTHGLRGEGEASARRRDAVLALERRADAFKLEGSTICTTTGNGPERCPLNWPVREAAREALERIADVRKSERTVATSKP